MRARARFRRLSVLPVPRLSALPFSRLPALLVVAAAATLVGCDDDDSVVAPPAGLDELVVLSRNLYLGGDIGRVLSAPTPEDIPVRVTETWVEVLQNDGLARAAALADEIAEVRPHVLGLQEASLFRIQVPGDAIQGNPVAAEAVALDLLAALLTELSDRGLEYEVAATAENIDVELPMAFSPTEFWDLRLTDRDVLLVRSDVAFDDAAAGNFQARATVPVGGSVPIEITRGWTRADIQLGDDAEIRVLNVHLEIPEVSPELQVAQMGETLGMLEGASTGILMGDLNSRADGTTTASYALALSDGFDDAWVQAGGGAGPTCCYSSDLRSPGLVSVQRIDYVLVRGSGLAVTDAFLVGDDPAERTPSGLWPSDHRGVGAAFDVQ